MKILQLYYKMPFPKNDGGAYAIYQSSLSLLSQPGLELKILAMSLTRSGNLKVQLPESFVSKTNFESVPVDNRIKLFKAVLNIFGKTSYFVERFYSAKYCDRLEQILQEEEFDVIQLEHLYLGLYLESIRKYSNAKIVLRAQNVEHKLWNEYLSMSTHYFYKPFLKVAIKRLALFETEVLNSVDGIMAISPADADVFKLLAVKKLIVEIPIGLDMKIFNKIDKEKQYINFPVFFHLGSMDWKPNIQALKWFIIEVLPQLILVYPDIKFVIAGKKMPDWFFKRQNKNIKVLAEVEDSIAFQEDKALLIVPLLAGSGLRVKILEAMAMGKTIISTSVGAKGIDFKTNENILIADTADEFVSQIGRCIKSETFCRTIGANAQQLVLERYELNRVGERMLQFYKSIL